MPRFIRRSIFRVSINAPSLPEWAIKVGSDVLVLDLEALPTKARKSLDQSVVKLAILNAAKSAAEVFVRVNRKNIDKDLELAVWPNLTGIVLPNVESAREIQKVDRRLSELEHLRQITEGYLQIDAEIGTAKGVLDSLQIARSSNRLVALTVAETSLYRDLCLDPEANQDSDPLQFIKGQIIAYACAAGIQAQGMSYPLSITLTEANDLQLRHAVRMARDMGFKGAVCPHVSWVNMCNDGFRPSREELAYYQKVVAVFEEGLSRGLASVPLDGRMIDTPVYKRAQVFLQWGEACQSRDVQAKAI